MSEIKRLNPGLVVSAQIRGGQSLPRQSAAIVGDTRAHALRELKRRQQRGEIESAGQLQLIPSGPHAGQYAIRVTLLPRRESPLWAKLCVGAGSVFLGLAALVAASGYFLSALSGASLVLLCLAVLVAFGVWVKVKHGRRRTTVVVNQIVNVGR